MVDSHEGGYLCKHFEQNEFSKNPACKRQRLILCFDGTWNKRDSGTNVYHLSNLICEGDVGVSNGVQWTQKIKYDEGVGTGLLDTVSGGAFGSGLSNNVREGYDWLVENYHGADDPNEADEIYIFGFSRGAFTARSLIGLIGKCGLLCRGAPISLEQLWEGYQILGRYPSARVGGVPEKNRWERIVGLPEKPFRELWEVKREKWEKSQSPPPKKPENRSEQLLRDWSRRVPITCVGVFDTVGSMGVDALAIPWLRTTMAKFHDTTLSSIIVNGFQALAIDEHRANFVHIPWLREAVGGTASRTTFLGGTIEQRWFAGAHSNIGGGYENDLLAHFPLDWMIRECKKLGLVFRADHQRIGQPPIDKFCPLMTPKPSGLAGEIRGDKPHVRDSFAEFAGILWQHVLRVKREYRQIAPPPELHHGKPMRSVNETVDDSVFELVAFSQNDALPYNPPNLWEYCKRKELEYDHEEESRESDENHLREYRKRKGWKCGSSPTHTYVDRGGIAYLALWMIVIGFGGYGLGKLVYQLALGKPGNVPLSWCLAFALPLFAVFIDWRESVLNYRLALEPSGQRAEQRMAWMELCLFIRLIAIVFFALGIGSIVFFLITRCPWLWRWPSREVGWLLALDALLLFFVAAQSWCAAPMNDAGLGSIVELQKRRRSEMVVEYLKALACDDKNDMGRDLLAPVARTLWRDILGFIPVYSLLIFIGTWLALPIFLPQPDGEKLLGLLSKDWLSIVLAAGLTGAGALADWAEDIIHLQYLDLFPKAPSQRLVDIAITMTSVKFILFGIGMLATVGVMIWLVCSAIIASGLGLFSVALAILLVWSAAKELVI